ncbi:restriction endonuclease subunit S [Accumulibacter sp.]|uniref:restriction endonuclease subunit S n=1 Tax=Accumulibacter sp. TaxID=2053492 RepID=UPI0025E474DB|nr:restriction endonuclease subunit S [Accumulibacter sp.]MCM8594660.1 restriction endonuclease subunit S [Accumulibacter sp.]MCM8625924.1 restriction endonuclease subunit S [Accumulibacter sp.]MDS4048806.1 restriction endonuclease subunit S [Accumulibacter sp.]
MSGWPTVRLEDCAEIVSGATPSTSESAYWDGDVCWATPKDLSELEGAYISDTPRKITRSGLQSCAATVLPPDSVLFSSRAPIGHVAINTVPMATNQGFKSFVPNRERVHAKFLYHWLRRNRPYLESLGNGATFKEVSKAVVARIEIPLPPLPEQRRIAEILDKADALRAKRRAALAELDTLTQSMFLEMFGDPATNPMGWPTRKVEDVAEIVSGATPRTDNESYWDGDVNWVTPKELSGLESMYIGETERRITRQGLESCAASILPPGSVLFSSRAPIGHTAICAAPMATNQGFKSFVPRPGALEPHFLLFWLRLRRSFLEGLGTGATFKEVSKAVVARIELFVPPFDLQSQFAQRVVALERVRSVQREGRGQLDALFTSVQHRAFRGEL